MFHPLVECRVARARTGLMQGVQECERGRRSSRGRVRDDMYASLHIYNGTLIEDRRL
jgi:hypothetical protein